MSQVFIHTLVFGRTSEGKWALTKANTNHGKFEIGPSENAAISIHSDIIEDFCSHVVQTIRPPLEAIVADEEKSKTE